MENQQKRTRVAGFRKGISRRQLRGKEALTLALPKPPSPPRQTQRDRIDDYFFSVLRGSFSSALRTRSRRLPCSDSSPSSFFCSP